MLKGFKEFLARGNIVDLSIAVVIGTAFTALVTKFTDSIIQPLINRIGAGGDSDYGILRINIGGGQAIDLNILLSAAINFILVAAVVYFLVVCPTTGCVRRARSSRRRTPSSPCLPRSATFLPTPMERPTSTAAKPRERAEPGYRRDDERRQELARPAAKNGEQKVAAPGATLEESRNDS